MTDTVRLNDEIKRSGLKKGGIAAELGLSAYSFWRKINNENQFKAGEIRELCKLLKFTSLKKRHEFFLLMSRLNDYNVAVGKGDVDGNEGYGEGEESHTEGMHPAWEKDGAEKRGQSNERRD